MQPVQDREFVENKALWPFLSRMLRYAYQHKTYFWLLVLNTAIIAAAEAIFPLIWLDYIDKVIAPFSESWQQGASKLSLDEAQSQLWRYGGWYVALIVVQAGSTAIMIYCGGKIRELVIYDLRKGLFNKLQDLSFSFYDRSATGWLISRLTSDTDRVSEVISWGLLELVWGFAMIIFSFLAMFVYSWPLALIVLAVIPLLLLVSVRLRALILQFSRKARKQNSEITSYYNEHISGIEVNKTTVQEQRASEKFREMSGLMRSFSYRSAYYTAIYAPLVVMVGSLAAAAVVYAGGHFLVAGLFGMTLGTLSAFFNYSRNIFFPIFDITRFYAMAQSSLSAGERIFSLLDEAPAIQDAPHTPDFAPLRGEVTFRGVHFHYVADKPILHDFDLHIRAGESVALVGPTGEGKTTIASLLCRFYEPQQGQVLIDGTDYRERSLHSYRQQLGVILQTPHLFSGSIRDNIRYGKLDATDAEIVSVLELIGAHQFVDKLDQEVGEEGSQLSMGEKQLVSFARTLLKDPKILVMDEATSSVDTLSERMVQRGVEQIIRGRTSLIIAHRLSTVRHCDRILVIQKGRILEEGNHDQLMAQKGKYFQLYTKQVVQDVGIG